MGNHSKQFVFEYNVLGNDFIFIYFHFSGDLLVDIQYSDANTGLYTNFGKGISSVLFQENSRFKYDKIFFLSIDLVLALLLFILIKGIKYKIKKQLWRFTTFFL